MVVTTIETDVSWASLEAYLMKLHILNVCGKDLEILENFTYLDNRIKAGPVRKTYKKLAPSLSMVFSVLE